MKARPAQFVTADLFAAAQPAAGRAVQDSARPASVRAVLSATSGATSEATPGTARVALRPRAQQLWYAVVFPDLCESEAVIRLPQLSRVAQQFTPLVSIDMPNALLLEIKGSVHLFGSAACLHAAIDALWLRYSLRAHSATAPTTLGALWCARVGRPVCIAETDRLVGTLAPLPVIATGWNADWLRRLHAMGVTRIGELLRLPRPGIARRLGPAALVDLDIALARQAAPRRAFMAPERFRERCDFEMDIETGRYLQQALEPVIERCAAFLRQRQAGIQALQLKLRHRAIPATRIRLGLASVTSDRQRLAAVLDEKLGRLELAAPVRGLTLSSASLQPLAADSLDAFAGLRAGGGWIAAAAPQLLERLRARLGEHAVYGVATVAEHRPEAAWRRVQELRLTAALRVAERSAPDRVRPIWLLDEPSLLSPDLERLGEAGVVLERGPERIESGWWDGNGVARDYYVARQRQGARWWIFQERQTLHWYLHGVFA